MDSLLKKKLTATLRECHTHLNRMTYAHGNIDEFMPVTADTVKALNDRRVEALDQYIYRFTKLQDAMGGRLFEQILQAVAEDTSSLAFIDKLNRLEKLGALSSAVEWLDLRQLRNTLAHEYDDNATELAEGINTVFGKFSDIKAILNQLERYVSPRL